MRIVVTGGTGFIGRPLCHRLIEEGHGLTVLTRNVHTATERLDPRISLVGWQDSQSSTPDVVGALTGCDAVINLAGAPIGARRWTARTKNRLRTSREGTTSALVTAMASLQTRPALLISASAIGYYGPQQDELLQEDRPSGTGFLASLCRQWEGEARVAERLGIPVTHLRIGVVLGKGGGALDKMLPAFRLGLGGPLGRGTQWMSWIHLDDLVELVAFLLNKAVSGPVNATSPNPVTNREFARLLGQALGRPARLPIPASLLKLLFGQMAEELLLTGQRVLPARAQGMGFRFRYPELTEALRAILA